MQIGRRIYYDLSTGNVVCDTGERQGDVVETTIDEDFLVFPSLKGYAQAQIGFVDLDYGAHAADYATGYVTHVDPTTQALTFTPFPQTDPAP